MDVLTTCARDPRTWKNEYAEGTDRVRGVLVRRFAVGQPHDPHGVRAAHAAARRSPRSRSEELDWVRRLGPSSTGLLDYLKRQHRSYDALVFYSLEHATTVEGVRCLPDRTHCLSVPAAAADAALRALGGTCSRRSGRSGSSPTPSGDLLPRYVSVDAAGGRSPSASASTRRRSWLIRDISRIRPTRSRRTTKPSPTPPEPEPTYLSARGVTFRRRHRLYGSFALYGGRVEPDNGCEEMLEYFGSYADTEDDGIPLVLMGVKLMKVAGAAARPRLAGVLPDRERMAAYEAADVTIAPSSDDLLAQSPLESFAVGTPVLASARNAAAVEHCRKSNAGLFYCQP